MKVVRTPLRLFDLDAHAMRGTDFFATVQRSALQKLQQNRHRIRKPSEYRCALCGGREGTTLLEWEAGYQVILCARCDYSTANFAIENEQSHVEQTYETEQYSQTLHDKCASYFEYRKAQMGSERYVYLIERLGLDPAKARVLDVGCGSGAVLSALQDRGVACRGLEVNPGAVEFCRRMGLDVRRTSLEEEEDRSYDVIAMFDVIEHLADPVSVLRTAVRKLKPGGYLVAFTPNIHSVAFELMGGRQNTLLPFEHVGFFSPKSFEYLGEQIGATVHTLDIYGLDVMDYLLMKEHEDGYDYTVKLKPMMSLLQGCVDRLGLGNHYRATLREGRPA